MQAIAILIAKLCNIGIANDGDKVVVETLAREFMHLCASDKDYSDSAVEDLVNDVEFYMDAVVRDNITI